MAIAHLNTPLRASEITGTVNEVIDVIPEAVTSENPLTDKNYVDTLVSAAVDAEATERSTADTTLQNNITALDNNTYKKDEMDTKLAAKADVADLTAHVSDSANPHSVTATQVGLGSVVNTGDSAVPTSGGTSKFTTGGAYTELNKKADKSTTLAGYGITNAYTKDETDAAINTAVEEGTAGKADKATTLAGYGITDAFTKTETNAAITAAVENKADKATTLAGYSIGDAYTKTQADAAISTAVSGKADKATTLAGYSITDAYTKTESDSKFALDSAISTVGKTNSYNDLDDKPTIPSTDVIEQEIEDRTNGDLNLQTQIDAITSQSDLTDIVGTHAELMAYDKPLYVGDIIKVLSDESITGSPRSYNRNTGGTAGSYTFELIGTEAEGYTKGEVDAALALKADVSVLTAHTSNTSNPHSVTKAQVGLGNVVNTGDSATPVSGGTTKFTTGGAYTELNKKADKATSLSGYGITNAYTKTEVDDAIDGAVENKADKATSLSGYGITNAYTKTETDTAISTAISGKADAATTLAGYGITDAKITGRNITLGSNTIAVPTEKSWTYNSSTLKLTFA